MKRIIVLTTTEKIRGKIKEAKNIGYCKMKYKNEPTFQKFAKTFNA